MADWFSQNAPQPSAAAAPPVAGGDWFAKNAPTAVSTATTPQSQPQRSWLDSAVDFGKGLWSNLAQSGQALVNTAEGAYNTVAHPIDTLQGKAGITKGMADVGAAQDAVRLKAEDAFKRGDYAEGVRHALGYVIPLVGPQIDASGDKAQKGKVAEALGEATGTGLQLAAPEALKGVSVPLTPKLTNPNPTEAGALDYLQDKGVPVPAGARTGNPFVKNAQAAADVTPVGAVVAQRAAARTTDALRTEAGNLADRAHPTPVVPEQAGAGARNALGHAAAQRGQEAQTSYGTFRQIEKGQPMPVDISDIKDELAPIYQDMQKWMQPALRNASAGFQAAKSILEGPDVIPASQAEAGLGGLKALARESGGRNAGIAKFVVPKLQDEIDSTVASVDPHALVELRAGRTAAAAQYGTQAILDDMRQEPVQAFNQLTYAKDAGIDYLRKVQAEAPGEMKKIGRAWLENAFEKAQQEGGFGHASKLYSDWENLGPETKRILFNPLLVTDLDKFFLGAKKLAENPNPSGTAILGISAGSLLAFTHPTTGVPLMLGAGAISKMLHSPAGVRALSNGVKISLKGPARTAAAAQLLRVAGKDAVPADDTQQEKQP
jgi:hypothetical protein